jgi:coenzyme PQQ precursor peptide PqqA
LQLIGDWTSIRLPARWQGTTARCAKANAEEAMAWTTPTLVEICIGLEINGYLPAEF